MKTITMICDNCGRQFCTEYYTGGYIDHMNMVNNFQVTLNQGIEAIIRDICMKGNDYRESLYDIEERKDCFIKWLQKQNIEKSFIDKVIEEVESTKQHISKLKNMTEQIQHRLNELDYNDRQFIIDNLFV